MSTSRELARHLNYYRMKTTGIRRIPEIAYNSYKSKFHPPSLEEGKAQSGCARMPNMMLSHVELELRMTDAAGVDEVKTINWVPNFASQAEREEFLLFT